MRWFSRTLYTHFFHLGVVLCQFFDTLNGKYQKLKKIATDPNYLRCHGFTTVLDFPKETTCSCKQDTKERYWRQPWILANGKAHFGSTDRNNQTDHCGPPSKLIWSFRSVGPKCAFHLPKFLSPVPLFCILLTTTNSFQWKVKYCE